jgi:hypothetical protein
VRKAVRWCSLDSVRAASETSISDAFARRRWDDLDDLDAAIERVLSDVEAPAVRSTLPDGAGNHRTQSDSPVVAAQSVSRAAAATSTTSKTGNGSSRS